MNKIELIEKKILNYFNSKLNVNITGKEIKLNLNNKNIGNIELDLLSGVEFKNLEEIDLSHNNISNIEPIKNFKKAKKIDLSYNKINDINSLKTIFENNKELKILNLSNNQINDIKIIKENISKSIIEINLDNNKLIQKDLEEIKELIKKNNKAITDKDENNNLKKNYIIAGIEIDKYNIGKNIRIINSFEECIREREYLNSNYKEKNSEFENEKEIRDNCQIKINNELIDFNYYYKFNKKGKYIIEYTFQNDIIHMNNMFNGCSSLTEINLSNLNNQNVTNMSCMLNGWNVSNCTDFYGMFEDCSKQIDKKPLENWKKTNKNFE